MQHNDYDRDSDLTDLGLVVAETKGGIVGFEDNAGTQQLEPGLSDD